MAIVLGFVFFATFGNGLKR